MPENNIKPRYKIRNVLQSYNLCGTCLERQFSDIPGGSINSSLYNGIQRRNGGCFICVDLTNSIDSTAERVRKSLSEYQFENFLLGTRLDHSVIEREDQVRSRYKLKGGEGVKQQLTRLVGKKVSDVLGKPVNFRKPDVEAIVNFSNGEIDVRSKPIFGFGRYVKLRRQLPQKLFGGVGLGKNSRSVESIIAKSLLTVSKGTNVSFAWIGGEDARSLVLGAGRPFISQIINPKFRKIGSKRILKLSKNRDIELKSFESVPSRPNSMPRFTTEIIANVNLPKPISKERIEEMSRFYDDKEVTCVTRRGRKITLKKVYSVGVDKLSKSTMALRIRCDGGLTIRKLISGGGDVSPSLSDVLMENLSVDDRKPFDVVDVTILPDV